MKRPILFFSAALLLFSCMQPAAPTVDLTAETANLQKASDDYHASIIALDFDRVKSFYATNATVMAPGEATVKGTEAVSNWIDAFKQAKNLQAKFTNVEVVVDEGGTMGHSLVIG